jgi:putative heme iron utilization protein
MKTLAAAVLAVGFAILAFAGQHAPLPPALIAAKTLYIENNSGQAKLADRCFDELSKWGRFKIVADRKDADVIFQIGTHVRTYGYSGQSHTNLDCDSAGQNTNCSGNSNTTLTPETAGFTTIAVVENRSGQVLWSDTRRWGNLFTGFRSATREVIKELRKRIEEQDKLNDQDNAAKR